jgi:hypothetical protein
MNEQFRKLLDQACELADEVFDYDGSDYAEIVQEKFAELIVQKCADIGALKADGNYEVYNSIVEYFGMQEPEE